MIPPRNIAPQATPPDGPGWEDEYRDELLGTTLLGRYMVFEINRGGFGLVLGVSDTHTGEDLAVKTPRPENRARSLPVEEFKAEVSFWLKLDPHPNIVTARSVETVFDCPALFMEYIRANPFKTVRDWLLSGGLNPESAVGLMHQVAIAMAFANRKGEIAHLDLKPENLLVDPDGICKVTDFGLARRVQVAGGRYEKNSAATWAYAAPEIFRQEVGDQRSDIFSYGLIFYELLTGRLPFPFEIAKDSAAAYRQLKEFHAGDGVRKITSDLYYNGLPDSGRELGVILSSCLQHSQSDREASFSSVLDLLERELGLKRPADAAGVAPHADPLQRAAGLRQAGSYSDAIKLLNHLLSREPGRADLWREAALTMRAMGDEAGAAQCEVRARSLAASIKFQRKG